MRLKLSIIFGLIFFIAGLLTLTHYNINWDATNHLPRGQAYLHYFLTGKKDYSDRPAWKKYWQNPDYLFVHSDIPKSEVTNRSIYEQDGTTFNDLINSDGYGHPPVSDILSSFFNVVLFQKLKLINDVDSYRIYGVLLSSLLVGLVYFWSSKIYGKLAGVISVLSLSLYPLFWAQSHFNTEKDIPETVFIGFFLFSFWKAVTTKKIIWIIFAAIVFGLGLGTKLNILFSIFVILPWFLIFFGRKIFERKNIGFIIFLGIIPIVGVLVLVTSWPYMWADPITGLTKMFTFYKDIGSSNVTPSLLPFGPINTFAIQTVVFATPPLILILAFFGIFNLKNKTSLLFLLWFIVPILRVSLPGTNIYGGVRQIMEYIPAMAILAGAGATFLFRKVKKMKFLFVILTFIILLLPLIKLHPNEEFYFNFLIGGLSGAKAKNYPSWAENYGSAYRQAVSWIDKNAPTGSEVVLPYELMPNIPSFFMRGDITFSNTLRSGYLRKGEYAIGLITEGVDDRSYYDAYLNRFLNPVYEAKVNGVDIIKVWKNDDQHLKNPLRDKLSTNVSYKVTDLGILVDIGRVEKVSRLEIDYKDGLCPRLKEGVIQLSVDNKEWLRLPGDLPDDWRISLIGEQPKGGKFVEPFVGQNARYISLTLTPADTCLKRVQNVRVYYFQ
jgi:hypothetical protein